MPAICNFCGKQFGQYITSKHIKQEHGLSRGEYAEMFGKSSLVAPEYVPPILRSEEIRKKIGKGVSKALKSKGKNHHAKRPEVRKKHRENALARVRTEKGKKQLDEARKGIDHKKISEKKKEGYWKTEKAQRDIERMVQASKKSRALLRLDPNYVHPSKKPEVRRKISIAVKKMHREGRFPPVYTMTRPHRKIVEAMKEADIYGGFVSEYLLRYRLDEGNPHLKIGIQIDGCYWHGCKTHKPEEKQRYAVTLSKHYQNLRCSPGWRIFRFWEHDIDQNFDGCLQVIHKAMSDSFFSVSPWSLL